MKKENEQGAIIVEASIALPVFVFTIFTILSIINICYVQSRIGIALNSSAKEISQYSYLYYKLGADKLEQKMNEGTEDARDVSEQTISGVVNVMDSLSDAKNSAQSGDFDKMLDDINDSKGTIDSLSETYGDKVASDPKQFIIGFGKMAMNEVKEEAKTYLGAAMAKGFMKKNLKSFKGDDPDKFLRRYHVVNGMKGLNFNYTTLMAYGSTNKIQLVCSYKVSILKLLNIDFKFNFRQIARTNAWGNGISKSKPQVSTTDENVSYWDNPNQLTRGKLFVVAEKKKYKYVDTGHGFDAYDNSSGKNEFVTITSMDTSAESNQGSDAIKNRLNSEYQKTYSAVSKLDKTITVKDKNEKSTTLTSDPSTRSVKIVLVTPDNADMATVQNAVSSFENEQKALGNNVSVQIVTGYGSPSKTEEKQ